MYRKAAYLRARDVYCVVSYLSLPDSIYTLLHVYPTRSVTRCAAPCACSNQPEIMELLIRKGADVNATNRGQCSALHVSVNKQHVGCVRVLVKANCNPNLQVAG